MNCHDFEAVAGDLAGERLMDAAQRENAIAHATSCAGCSTRLADERALTDGLRVLVRANEDAPARIEAALLTAFRGQRPALPSVARARSVGRQWAYVAASVAAIALIVALLSLVSSRARSSQEPAPRKAANPNPAVPDEPRPAPPRQVSASPESTVAADKHRPADRGKKRKKGRPTPPLEDLNRSAEIATDFIPLMNRETFGEMDGGQVMRVELPRSALMSFGLPMDMERATEPIKADVVVGSDGLARAIRFVR